MAKRVLVIGDIMVDRYVHVWTERNAPEAPIPVWNQESVETRLGGAANVAHNLKALGGEDVEVHLGGVVGEFSSQIEKAGIDCRFCVGQRTMIKERFVERGTNRFLFRTDSQPAILSEDSDELERMLRENVTKQYDAVIFSDYNKGTVTKGVVDAVRATQFNELYVVDSKRIDLSIFKGMHLLKVNEQEYSVQVSRGPYTNVEGLFKAVVVTKGGKGAQLRQAVEQITDRRLENEPKVVQTAGNRYIIDSEDFPTIAVKAVDVTGCGDTHTAAMTFSMLFHNDLRRAVKFANECARNVVQKFGTSVVSR